MPRIARPSALAAAWLAAPALALTLAGCTAAEAGPEIHSSTAAPETVTETITATVTMVTTSATTVTETSCAPTSTTSSTTPAPTTSTPVATTPARAIAPAVAIPSKPKWTPPPTPTTPYVPPAPASAYYRNCAAARAAGAAPLYAGQPGYRSALDRDGDGIACEWS